MQKLLWCEKVPNNESLFAGINNQISANDGIESTNTRKRKQSLWVSYSQGCNVISWILKIQQWVNDRDMVKGTLDPHCPRILSVYMQTIALLWADAQWWVALTSSLHRHSSQNPARAQSEEKEHDPCKPAFLCNWIKPIKLVLCPRMDSRRKFTYHRKWEIQCMYYKKTQLSNHGSMYRESRQLQVCQTTQKTVWRNF